VRPGEQVSGTDGCGGLATLRVIECGPPAVLEVETCERGSRPARMAWVLAGPPEGERGDWLVEKLAELGVGVFQPIHCERGRWEKAEERLERWRRLAVAALRQSRRRHLMTLRAPVTLAEAVEVLPAEAARFLADPSGDPAAFIPPPAVGESAGIIGPAAGFSEAELASLRGRACRPIALADGRLRAETAALAWASWWAAAAGKGEERS
jgi:16S rRNA (uracil1498-N3)-methyltransferase